MTQQSIRGFPPLAYRDGIKSLGKFGQRNGIAESIRNARRTATLSQKLLAANAGIGLSAMRGVETGIARITSLNAVLNALGLEIRGRNLIAGPVGQAMALARKRRKLSRRKLAIALQIDRDTLAAIEGGGGLMQGLEAFGAAVGAGLYLAKIGEPKVFFANAGNSSGHHGWETPADLAELLSEAVGGFDLDPCAATTVQKYARVKARVLLAVQDDGLTANWFGKVFCNPPYGRSLSRWIMKCAMEGERGATVVALIPSRTDTRYWHHHIAGKADVWMLKGRLKFGDGSTPSPFPSAIAVWNGDDELRNRLSEALPDAWHVAPLSLPIA
jgi:transcriptional regulator with XRE-family HTH domain